MVACSSRGDAIASRSLVLAPPADRLSKAVAASTPDLYDPTLSCDRRNDPPKEIGLLAKTNPIDNDGERYSSNPPSSGISASRGRSETCTTEPGFGGTFSSRGSPHIIERLSEHSRADSERVDLAAPPDVLIG
jgi:hypothetical protein